MNKPPTTKPATVTSKTETSTKQDDAPPALEELERRNQARYPRPDDDDVGLRVVRAHRRRMLIE